MIMMTTRLLKRIVPVAVMGTALGLLGVSSGDTMGHDRDHNKDRDKDHDKDRDKDHDRDCDFDHDKDHDEDGNAIHFNMIVSAGAQQCLPNARARVTITSLGPVEKMRVKVCGLRPNTDFDFFVIQVPKAPFGLSWYQGDIDTDEHGSASAEFIGRFNIETFIVAPGVAPAPIVFENKDFPNFSDTDKNPQTQPVHTYHLGLWFNSPKDAAAQGCPATVTPFNGEHNAGIQVLNTANFKDLEGPLRQLMP
jgi:hypothetical protein